MSKPRWPSVGVGLGAATIGWTIWSPPATAFDYALRLQLVVLFCHQFEEYVLPGGFTEFYNQHIFGRNPLMRYPLTEWGVYLVNIVLAWTLYVAACFLPQIPLFGMGLAITHLMNAVGHVGFGVARKRYNPGLLTAAFLLVPAAVWVLWLGTPMLDGGQLALLALAVPLTAILIEAAIALGTKFNQTRLGD